MSPAASISGWCLVSAARPKSLSLQVNFARQIHRNYYDSLGLTPKASQGEIKQAYYKLSLKYHPDKSTGEDAKFREITAAYEVLGNKKLRGLYDRGALPGGRSHISEPAPHMDVTTDAFKMQTTKQKVPSTGRTMEFNFDDWSKAHYGKVFRDQENRRMKVEAKRNSEIDSNQMARIELLIFFGILFIGLAVGTSRMIFNARQFDKPSNPKPPR